MKISLKWLSEFFSDTPKMDLSSVSTKIRTELPLSGIEVGSFRNLGEGIEGVLVGQIQSFEKHPSADRLNVCQVADGHGKILQIVCGAPNVKAGIKVALAPVGTQLPGNILIKQAQIRGVSSSGMLCSDKELSLSEESTGILHLPDSAPLGSSLIKALGLQDQIFEMELTPDRSDCLSHLGIAREVGRIIGKKIQLPEIEAINPSDSGDVPLMNVEVQASKACPIYGAQLFEGIQSHQSPEWMKRLLENLGHRSHNAVVDISNYVLLELGHPLHTFDADKITGSKIIVRFAKAGEKLLTLDGIERTLHGEDLIISDLEKPLALAGVMGGLSSGVTEKTTRIVLESALFNPAVIRAMSQRHKIHSEASHRFERGVDAQGVLRSAGRAALLLKKLCATRRRGSFIEVKNPPSEKLLQKSLFNFDTRAIKQVAGIESSSEEIIQALQSVGIEAQSKSQNVLKVEIPTYRLDLQREIDLVEEVARLIGYSEIIERYPIQKSSTASLTGSLYKKIRQIRRRLLESGLTEMMPYSFVSQSQVDFLAPQNLTVLANPLSEEWRYMRPNLFFGLLQVLARQAAWGQARGSFFDCGHVFQKEKQSTEKLLEKSTQCQESYHGAWALMGLRSEEHWSSDKNSTERKAHVDFFDAKGIAEKMIEGLSALEPRWASSQFVNLSEVSEELLSLQAPWIPQKLLHPYRSALIVWPGKSPLEIKGYVGELHPAYKGELLNLPTGLQLGAALGELRVFENLLKEMESSKAQSSAVILNHGKITVSRKIPIVERDLALVFDPSVKAEDIRRTVKQALASNLLDFKMLDLFKMPDGRHSIAFRLYLQGEDKTFLDEEIQNLSKAVVESLQKKFKAELRA